MVAELVGAEADTDALFPLRVGGERKMNRIREIREAAGLSLQDLADRISELSGEATTRTQLSRLELGKRKLTQDWLRKIAMALDCDVAELLDHVAMTAGADEVEPLQLTDVIPAVAQALAAKGLTVYRLRKSYLTGIGIVEGDILTFERHDGGEIPNLSVVLVQAGDHLVVRQFVAPSSLLANTQQHPTVISLNSRTARVEIIGILVNQ